MERKTTPDDAFRLPTPLAATIREVLPFVSGRTVEAVVVEVHDYADAFRGRTGRRIEEAVAVALGGFLDVSSQPAGRSADPAGTALHGARRLGAGEARNGRSVDALLAAYRVGARTAWRELSRIAVDADLSARDLGRFAEAVFAYIDRLSAASVTGHAEHLAATGLAGQRRREQLALDLVRGAPAEDLTAAAQRANWIPTRTLTAVVLPVASEQEVHRSLDARTLRSPEDVPVGAGYAVLLVPDAGGAARPRLMESVGSCGAAIGPARPWTEVRSSARRAVRALELDPRDGDPPIDTERRLVELVLLADREAFDDLQARALAPLDGVRATAREKLVDTLRAWLRHHGRRDAVASELVVHPQTVRYRIDQVRSLYGPAFDDPETILDLTLALAPPLRTAPP